MNTKSEVLKKFKQFLELRYTGSTPRTYHDHVKLFLEYTSKPPMRVNNEDILNYNIHIRNTGNSYRNVSINAIKAYFKLILKKQVKEFSSIRPKKEILVTKYFDAEVVREKILNIENIKQRTILMIGLSGWLRVGETLALKCKDIDSHNMVIHIRQSKGAKDRDVELTEDMYNLLREYGKIYLKGAKPDDYLFQGQDKSKPYSRSSCNAIVKDKLYKNMRYHDLRGSGATFAHNKGTSLLDVSKQLGHAKLETTKHYIPDTRKTLVTVF